MSEKKVGYATAMQGSAWSHSLNIPEKANSVEKNNVDDTKHMTQILLP